MNNIDCGDTITHNFVAISQIVLLNSFTDSSAVTVHLCCPYIFGTSICHPVEEHVPWLFYKDENHLGARSRNILWLCTKDTKLLN